MNFKRIIVLAMLASLQTTGWSQVFRQTENGIKARIQAIDVEVQFFSPEIVRIIKLPAGGSVQKSLSVIAAPQKLPVKISTQKNEWIVSSSALQVTINRQTAAIQFSAAGKLLLQEKEDGTHFSPSEDTNTYEVKQAFQ